MRRRTAPIATTAALTLLVAGCAGSANHEYAVQDDTGIWLADGYSQGVGEQFEFDGDFCGAAGSVLVWSEASGGSLSVRAFDTTSNHEVWSIPSASCGPAVDGSVTVSVLNAGASQIERVDIASGDRTPVLSAGANVVNPSIVGETESGLLLQVAVGQPFLGLVEDERSVWEFDISAQHSCRLISDVVGCAGPVDFWVLSAVDGEELVHRPLGSQENVTWLSDGFAVTNPAGSDEEDTPSPGTIFDFDGNEVRELTESDDLPTAPRGALFSHEDFTESDVAAIDAAGQPLATLDSDGLHFGDETIGPETAYPYSVTRDGSVMLVDQDGLVSLVDSAGATIADLVPSDAQVRIVDGLIIVFDTDQWESRVYLPAA